MRFLCFLLAIAILFSPLTEARDRKKEAEELRQLLHGKEVIVRDQTWRICRYDSDCIVADSICPGTYWVINKNRLWQNDRVNQQLRQVTTCENLRHIKPEAVQCTNAICVAR